MGSAKRLAFAFAFEAGLGLVAVGLGWILGVDPWKLDGSMWRAPALGLAAALPLIGALMATFTSSWQPLVNLRKIVRQMVGRFFGTLSVPGVLLLSLGAGFGEELLFRGFLQDWVAGGLGPAAGLVIAALAFGLLHWITTAYAVYATVLGAYMGLLYLATGNILAPVLCHAAYDAFALLYVARRTGPESGGAAEGT